MKLGIDIGGTNTVFGIVTEEGHILSQSFIPTKGHENAQAFVIKLYEAAQAFFSEAQMNRISSIGVGAPNGNYYSGNIEFAPNLEWKGVIPLAEMLNKQFQKPVRVTNDANAAALGEMMYGAAKGMKDFIMITLGTGVGSGFVSNGELIYGHDGFAGELGHLIAVRDGRACGCGRKGCLETYTSATGIVRTVDYFLKEEKKESILASLEYINSVDIYEAALAGDALALDVFDYTGKILGQTLADAVAITSPEAIILFGGLARAGKFIFEPTQKYMEENMLSIYKNKVKLLPSLLNESDAAILGAAAVG